jgi:beta-galactosidase
MNILSLYKNWKFKLGDFPDAWQKGYNADEWDNVNIPHDWSVKLPFSKEYSSGTGYLAGGIGWYRKSFKLPEEYRGKKVWIVFDGVYKNSQVWCNSYYLGKWPYGYTTFSYDITDQVCFGDMENIISVKVDHSDISDSRWFTGSGITRNVQIIVKESVYIEPDGVFFTTPMVTEDEANISIENTLFNSTEREMQATVESIITSPSGIEEYCFKKSCVISAGNGIKVTTEGTAINPELWSIDSPKLYTLTTRLVDAGGVVLDTYEGKVGIRSFTFDPDKGFSLNGASMKIKGVCVHHDAGCLGAAVLPKVWARRLSKLKKMGCNAIRMSHNPHMPELYDLCDSMGFLVMDEAFDEWEGPKNKWSTGHNVYPPKHQGYYEDFPQWHERDLKAMVKRGRNHPSIIMWSIGNEIDYPNDPYCHPLFNTMTGNNDANKPAAERMYNPDKPNTERLSVLAKILSDIVRQADTTRPVTLAAAFPELSTQIGFIDSLDVVGYNYKEHLYAQDHERFPLKPFIGSENHHSLSAWRVVEYNDYIAGQFLWTGIDYLGEAHGWPIHGSGAGEMTLAGFEKPSYYFRQSLWCKEPVLKIFTCRVDETLNDEWKRVYQKWNYVSGEMVQVRCYTNIAGAELLCNGKSLGVKSLDKENGYISWILPFEEGNIEVVGKDKGFKDDINISDKLETTKASCAIELSLWKDKYDNQYNDKFLYDGIDIEQIEVIVADAQGRRVVEDSTMMLVTVRGPGALLGIENGDLADVTDYSAPYRRACEGRMLIYVQRAGEGEIAIIVQGDGLKNAMLVI